MSWGQEFAVGKFDCSNLIVVIGLFVLALSFVIFDLAEEVSSLNGEGPVIGITGWTEGQAGCWVDAINMGRVCAHSARFGYCNL